jgi:hypothetical protein
MQQTPPVSWLSFLRLIATLYWVARVLVCTPRASVREAMN